MLSIIIPVFNVDYYIARCIESVLKQSYTDFELLLVVSKQSIDKSFEICRDYAEKDPRITLIHEEIYGAASARNIGIDRAKGEYIGFVDADDYIDFDMFETMIEASESNGTDMAMCGYYVHFTTNNCNIADADTVVGGVFDQKGCVDSAYVINGIACGKIENFLWNKVFKRKLFEDVRLPNRAIFEDASVVYQLVHKSKRVSIVDKPLYHYIKRNGSLTRTISLNNRLDSLCYFDDFYSFIKENYNEVIPNCGRLLYSLCVTMANYRMRVSGEERKKYRVECLKHYDKYKSEWQQLSSQLSKSQKMALWCFLRVTEPFDVLGLSIELVRRKVFKRER